MKKLRLIQYRVRQLLLGADPEALFFAAALFMVVLGLCFSSMNLLVLAGGFLLFVYGLAVALWLRDNYG
jgi:hypothetical protein